MASFSVKSFCEEPSLFKIRDRNVTKDDWKFIAVYFDIKVPSSMTKKVMRENVAKNLIAKGILGSDAVELLLYEEEEQEEVEVKKLLCPDESSWSAERLAFEKEKLRVTNELERERIAAERERIAI